MIDKQKYNSFITNGDYIGAANYISKFHFENSEQQRVLNESIKDLRARGRMYKGLMSKADNDQRNAIAFINGLKDNQLPGLSRNVSSENDINKYSEDYSHIKRNFYSTKDRTAESIKINFGGNIDKRYGVLGLDFLAKDVKYDNDAFTDMLRITGLNKKALENSGAKIQYNNGTYSLTISKRNNLFDTIYDALTQLHSLDNERIYRFNIDGIDSKGKVIERENRNSFLASVGGRIDTTNNVALDENGSFFALKHAKENAIKKANELLTPNDNRSDYEITKSSETLPFSCAREMDINEAVRSGRMKPELANFLLKETKDAITNGLINSSFTQYELWANNPKEKDAETRHKIEDTNLKSHYQELVRNAIGKNNISIAACMQGNQTGTLITIGGKFDDDENVDVDDISNSDTNKKHLQIFIPGFLNDEAEKMFNKRSETRAMKELSNMESYGYDVDIPNSGKLKVYNDYNSGASIWQLVQSDGSYRTIDKEDALKEMNKLIIAEDGIDLANQQFYNENGEFRSNIRNSDGTINKQFNKELFNQINNYSWAAMRELYPDSWKSFAPIANETISGNTDSDEYKEKLSKAMSSFIDSDNIGFLRNNHYLLSNYILDNIGYYDNYNIN